MKHCSSCREILPDEANYCGACGHEATIPGLNVPPADPTLSTIQDFDIDLDELEFEGDPVIIEDLDGG